MKEHAEKRPVAGSTIIPCLRYRDAPAAIDWLCRAFGFERHAVHPDGNGGIAHAQLVLGRGMVMLGSIGRDSDWSRRVGQPDEFGGRETQSPYVVVDDPASHCERARAAGARIVMEPTAQDYGGSNYCCLDPEGRLWSFGDYDPWASMEPDTGKPAS